MAKFNGKRTAETKKIEQLLLKHFPDHPSEYPPSAYRYNPASIRVRVVSDRFNGMDRVDRSDLVYPILKNNLAEDTWQDIMLIILLTPEELEDSVANREFEKPTPSRI